MTNPDSMPPKYSPTEDYLGRLFVAIEIRNARRAAGYSQVKLAESLGVSPYTVAKWEQAVKFPCLKSQVALRRVLPGADKIFDKNQGGA